MADVAVPHIHSLGELLDRVRAEPAAGHLRMIGITGPPGAGKTTLVEAVLGGLQAHSSDGASQQVAHVPGDGFHLADAELARLGRLDRKGAPDTFDAAGYAALLARLRDRSAVETVYAPAFDRDIEQPVAGSIPIAPTCRLVLTECNYLLLEEAPWAAVRRCLDEVWFIEIEDDLRRRRLVERHIAFGKSRSAAEAWVRDLDEPNAQRVMRCRERADVVVAVADARPSPDR